MKIFGIVFFYLTFLFWSFLSKNSFALSTADWMSELYYTQPNTRLIDIIIPGTHNSATYGVTPFSKVEKGQPFIFNFIRPLVYSWSKTQFRTIREQLVGGIRFIDLRIMFDKNHTPFIAHGLISIPLIDVLNDILAFTTEHPKEIILISYDLEFAYYLYLTTSGRATPTSDDIAQFIENYLSNYIIPFSTHLEIKDFWQSQKSILLLKPNQYQAWWPNAYTLEEVWNYLNINIPHRIPTYFSNIELIYTPPSSISFFLNPKYSFTFKLEQNGLSILSTDLRNHAIDWIRTWHQSGYSMNIITTDFYDQFPFVDTILELNNKTTPL